MSPAKCCAQGSPNRTTGLPSEAAIHRHFLANSHTAHRTQHATLRAERELYSIDGRLKYFESLTSLGTVIKRLPAPGCEVVGLSDE